MRYATIAAIVTGRSLGFGVAGLIVMMAAGGHAWTGTPPQATQTPPLFRTVTTVAEVPVRVLTREGTPVPGLLPQDFEVVIDGGEQEVVAARHVSLAELPRKTRPAGAGWPPSDVASNQATAAAERAIVFVIDPEMLILPLFERVLTRLFGALTSSDLVAVVFPQRSDLSEDFTADPARVFNTMSRLRAASDRNDLRVTRRTMQNALTSLKAIPVPQRMIVWVSRGFNVSMLPAVRDEGGPVDGLALAKARVQSDEIYNLLESGARAGIPIHTIDPSGLQNGRTALTELLRVVSLATGGQSVVGRSDILTAGPSILAENEDYYVVGFRIPGGARPDRMSDLSIRVRGRPEVQVHAPRGYVPPVNRAVAADARARLLADLGAGGGRSDIDMEMTVSPIQPTSRGRTLVAVTATIRLPPDSPQGADAAGRDMTLDLAAMAVTADARLVASIDRRVDIPAATRQRLHEPVVLTDYLEVPSGRSFIRVGVTDRANGTSGTVSLGVDVPRLSMEKSALSPLVIGRQEADTAASWSARADVLPFQPTTIRRFSREETLHVYARIFGSGSESAALKILAGDEVIRTTTLTVSSVHERLSGRHVLGGVRLDGLPIGAYRLVLEWIGADKKPIHQAVAFEIVPGG